MNLFASFILRALVVLVKDVVWDNSRPTNPNSEEGWMSYMSEVISSPLTKLLLPPHGSALGVTGQAGGAGEGGREITFNL